MCSNSAEERIQLIPRILTLSMTSNLVYMIRFSLDPRIMIQVLVTSKSGISSENRRTWTPLADIVIMISLVSFVLICDLLLGHAP